MEFVYDEEVALAYDAAVPVSPAEIEFYLELAKGAADQGLPTLELACGTGRIALPLAQASVQITGLDRSQAMLTRAREKSADMPSAEWIQGDMTSFELGKSFGLAIIPAGSFQLLLTTADQLACLRCIHHHLTPGGRLALELGNPNIVAIGEWLGVKRGTLQRRPQRDYREPASGNQMYSWGSVEYHPSEQKSMGWGVTEEVDEQGVVIQRKYGQPMELRYFFRFEIEHLLARCGFEVEALYGDVHKTEFRGNSPSMIWVARKVSETP